jgi:hypothetical protein
LIGNLGSRQRGRDLSNPAEVQYWRICDRFIGQGLICPDWKKVAGTRGEFTPEGHYKRLGNELIAELVWGGIESLVATRTAAEAGKL